MKIRLMFLFLVCSVSFSIELQAQDNTVAKPEVENKSLLNRIIERTSVSPHIGLLHSWGDFKKDGFMPSFAQPEYNKLGFGINGDFHLTNYLSVSGGILYGSLEGRLDDVNTANATNGNFNLGTGIQYNTDILELMLPRIDLNLSRLIFKDRVKFFNKVSFGVLASYSLVKYDSKIYAQSDEDVNLLYSKTRGRTGKTTEAVASFGGKISYVVNNRLDISLEASLRNVFNDKLDAWVAGDYNDAYSYSAIGITYHLKKRDYIVKNQMTEVEELPLKTAEPIEVIEEKTPKTIEKSNTIFGKYEYQKLPAGNTALVVLDENGMPIDTIYTNELGFFEYTKLNADQKVSFKPLNLDELNANDISLYTLNNENGKKIEEFSFESKKVEEKVIDSKPAETTKKVTSADKTKVALSEEEGYFVTIAAFRKERTARIMADEVSETGLTPTIIRNLQGTWYLITVSRHTTKAEALQEMQVIREKGFPKAWVHIKRKL